MAGARITSGREVDIVPTITTPNIHNVALLGHSGSGKTTLCEALAFCAGAIARKGRVEEGSTVSDFEPEELRHRASLSLSVVSFECDGHQYNVFDTPGLPDFVTEAELALPAADLAVIVVSATDGVEVQTEALWALASRLGIPRLIFVNKLDAERAEYERVLDQCRDLFGSGIAPLELPLYSAGHVDGVADLLTDQAVTYVDGVGRTGPIPDDIAELEHRVRENLVEGIVVGNDALMERYLDGDTPPPDELETTLAQGIGDGTVFPVLCGSALTGVGVDRLRAFLAEVSTHRSTRAVAGDTEVEISPDPSAAPLARAIKTFVDPFVGKLSLIQVCSGTILPDTVLVNSRTKEDERIHLLQRLSGKRTTPVPAGVAGDIIVVPKLADVRAGDTLAPAGKPVVIPPPEMSEPAFSIAIRPHGTGDDDRLMSALQRLGDEDPALVVTRNDETRQTVLSGIGDAHLQVALERLARKFGVEVEREEIVVPYRQTVSHAAQAEGRYKKQTGGHGQFGVAHVRIEPIERGRGFEFVDEVVGGAVPRQFIPAVEKGVRRAMHQGGGYGLPVIDVRVTLDDGKSHAVDSSEASFEQAGALAFSEALAAADPVPLEPVSRLEVVVPSRYLGDTLSDITARRARVLSSEADERGIQTIVALVPTIELGRYAVDLRALSGGYGRFHVEHDHCAVVPPHLADRVPRLKSAVS
jgi:elongation factor G